MTEQEETQALMLQLCLLEKECPNIWHHQMGSNPANVHITHSNCPTCHGSGKVPLLDPELVREKCPCDTPEGHEGNHCESCGWGEIAFIHDPDCSECQGRLWVPTQDPWKWFEAVGKVRYLFLAIPKTHHEKKWACAIEDGLKDNKGIAVEADTAELAFFRALATALNCSQATGGSDG